ncbi:MAG TPA: hypothetical protein VHT03_11735 [Rhizomicrobium sp.]|jgi:hypothetical protein|nr:hypothetical protein [Rhizomicrobium sp.]
MQSLTKTLLLGAAGSALAVAPAIAGAPHLLRVIPTANGLVFKTGATHYKTPTATKCNSAGTKCKTTFPNGSVAYTGHESTMYLNFKKLGGGETWYSYTNGVCHTYPSKAKASRDANATIKKYTIKQHVTLSKCSGTLTYYAPKYELTNSTVSQDKFKWNDTIKFKSGSKYYTWIAIQKYTVNIQ